MRRADPAFGSESQVDVTAASVTVPSAKRVSVDGCYQQSPNPLGVAIARSQRPHTGAFLIPGMRSRGESGSFALRIVLSRPTPAEAPFELVQFRCTPQRDKRELN